MSQINGKVTGEGRLGNTQQTAQVAIVPDNCHPSSFLILKIIFGGPAWQSSDVWFLRCMERQTDAHHNTLHPRQGGVIMAL